MQMVITMIEDMHANVLAHALQRLDGQSLAAASHMMSGLCELVVDQKSWHALCLTEWP
jgi:hypothetical protein